MLLFWNRAVRDCEELHVRHSAEPSIEQSCIGTGYREPGTSGKDGDVLLIMLAHEVHALQLKSILDKINHKGPKL